MAFSEWTYVSTVVCLFECRKIWVTTGTQTLWASAWQNQIHPPWIPRAPPTAFSRATRYTHERACTHTHLSNPLSGDARWLSSGHWRRSWSLLFVLQLSGSMMSLFSSGDFGVVEVRGRIQYSLVYDDHKEELQVKVYCCEDIASARRNRSDPWVKGCAWNWQRPSDPLRENGACSFHRYVKTYLLPDKSHHSKKKTSVKKKTLNPVYDQTLRVRASRLHVA